VLSRDANDRGQQKSGGDGLPTRKTWDCAGHDSRL
jgi:hypothetical protein